MVFYAVTLVGAPRVCFACSDSFRIHADTRNIIDHRQDMLELGLSDHPCRIITDHDERTSAAYALHLYMPDRRYTVSIAAEVGTEVNSMSVAVKSEGMRFTRYNLPPEKIAEVIGSADSETFFLPEDTDFDDGERRLFIAQLQAIMQHYSAGTTSEHLLALSDWYEIVAMLDARFRRTVSDSATNRDSGALYTYKAKKYICAHLGEELKLEAIAEELSITAPYLSMLFRRTTGQTVTDYIGNMRCRQIREQILHTDDSFVEICARAGLTNHRYAQRLFKKNFGISMQRCRQLGSGLSLYHENPWKMESIERDIYAAEAAEEEE